MTAIAENGNGRGGNRWRIAVWGGASCLLLLPLVAMQFDTGVTWTGLDFMVFGTMLAIACGTYEFGARITRNTMYRAAVGVAVAAAFFLVWINIAVGIIGSENNPANLMFGGVLMVGVIGALIARFRPLAMARVMVAMALGQVVVAGVTLATGVDLTVMALTGVFTALWLASAALFRKAAQQQASASAAS